MYSQRNAFTPHLAYTNMKRHTSDVSERLIASARATMHEVTARAGHCRVVVAVSGGQDSVALLHILAWLREPLGLDLRVAHIEHSLRGEESRRDAEFVQEVASSLDIPAAAYIVDAAGAAKRLHIGIQSAARQLRHKRLNEAAQAHGNALIALGHTQDDRVETLLLNLVRGCGIQGLAAMPAFAPPIVRPLLGAPRQETEFYCEENGLEFRTDSSNSSTKYLRNRIRSELLPNLRSYYNPGVSAALARLAQIAEEESTALDALAHAALDRATLSSDGQGVRLDSAELCSLPNWIARRVVRAAIGLVSGSLTDIEYAAVDRVLVGIREATLGHRFQWTLPLGNNRVSANGREVEFTSVSAPASPLPAYYPVAIPGETNAARFGLVVRTSIAQEAMNPAIASAMTAEFDAEFIQGALVARNRRPGDRLHLEASGGTQKVQDLMVNRKAPRVSRDEVLVLADDCGPLWVVGHRIGARARPHGLTKSILRISLEPLAAAQQE